MSERDAFAVWIAGAVLRARDLEFEADALASTASLCATPGELDAALRETTGKGPRPGDFGLEFIGPLVPFVLVEFGRAMWDAYAGRVAKRGGEALADLTIWEARELARRTWAGDPMISLADAESRLRAAATKAGLNEQRTEDLLASLRGPEIKPELNQDDD